VLRFEVKAGERGTLFGSVTPTNIVDELWRARKVRVDRRKIHLGDPIKRVGRYEVPIDVFEGVRVDVKTLVVPEGGELPSEDELAAWEAEEAAEAAAAAGVESAPDDGDAAGEELTEAEHAAAGELGDEALETVPGELDTSAEADEGVDDADEERDPAA
jgi:large subunit ribosomal protein L9